MEGPRLGSLRRAQAMSHTYLKEIVHPFSFTIAALSSEHPERLILIEKTCLKGRRRKVNEREIEVSFSVTFSLSSRFL